jgi:hypothetical protein
MASAYGYTSGVPASRGTGTRLAKRGLQAVTQIMEIVAKLIGFLSRVSTGG